MAKLSLADQIRRANGPNPKSVELGERYRLWYWDPVGALELTFIEAEERNPLRYAHLAMTAPSTFTKGPRYIRYAPVTREMLIGREYEIEFWDGQVSLHFTDFHKTDLGWPDIYKRVKRMAHEFKRGNIVASTDPGYPLHCGGGIYTHAIVVSEQPLVLVSESSDMRWESTVRPDKLKAIGQATAEQLAVCDKRL